MSRVIASLLLLAPSLSFAAGLTFGENGSKALSLGGAFAGQADDLTAIQHNPAGLAQQKGFGFLLDTELINHDVSFLRAQANVEEVHNTGGIFFLPFLAGSYNTTVLDRSLTLAFGAYGPPTDGRYVFPEPDYTKNEAGTGFARTPRKYAPQRFMLTKNDLIILYPGISAAMQVHPMVSVGFSFQYVVAKLKFSQTITTSDALGTVTEDPNLDAQVSVDMQGKPTFAGVVGVLVKPLDNLQIGLTARPPTTVNASGKMYITLGELASSTARIDGDNADLTIKLPLEVKMGVHYRPIDPVGINLDLVYEGWQAYKELLLTPRDITQTLGAGEPQPIGQIHVVKNWRQVFGARAGGSYRFGFGLEARAGVLFEQQASPNEYFNIDFAHLTRVFITAGASYPVGPIEIALGGAYTPTQTLVVDNSDVRQVTSNPSNQGLVVGNGTYTTGGWIATLGVRGRFGIK